MSDYTPNSSLRSVGRIGQARWVTALARRDAEDPALFVRLYHDAGVACGLNPDLALAQACEETGWFSSDRWEYQRNPAGLGITSDDVPGHQFRDALDGIRAHYAHLAAYAYTAADCPIHRLGWVDIRPHFHDGNPALSHLQDDRRQWATKPLYVARILAIANAVLNAPQPPGATKPPEAGNCPGPQDRGPV